MPIATSPNPPQRSNSVATLPPPQTFDILPLLYPILTRLLPRDAAESPDTAPSLSPKELGTAAQAVHNKIQKARVAVRDLPGIGMSLEDQEIVINELEEEVRRLDGVMEGIRAKAREALEKIQEPSVADEPMATVEET